MKIHQQHSQIYLKKSALVLVHLASWSILNSIIYYDHNWFVSVPDFFQTLPFWCWTEGQAAKLGFLQCLSHQHQLIWNLNWQLHLFFFSLPHSFTRVIVCIVICFYGSTSKCSLQLRFNKPVHHQNVVITELQQLPFNEKKILWRYFTTWDVFVQEYISTICFVYVLCVTTQLTTFFL